LYQKSEAAGDKVKAEEYFNESLNYYNQGIAKDAKNVDAIYSVGALYYNRAAVLTQKLNKLADDYSKDGLKKYQDMRAQVFEQFEKALPFFKKAENLDPNDTNTLIALKEIFAKKDQLDISKALKERLENVQAGKKNETPYFKE
jgi:tetratricopeptide (TPR) repeat protein